MFSLMSIKYWLGLGAVALIAFVAWDYASTKSALASRNADVARLKANIEAITTTHNLNVEALKSLDKSCKAQVDRLMNLHDIEKILKEAADPIGAAIDFDPNKARK